MAYPNIIIDQKFSKLNIPLILGVVFARIKVQKETPMLWEQISSIFQTRLGMTNQAIRSLKEVDALRKAYFLLGKKPADFLGSNEALLSRAAKGKGLNSINNIVDINNLVSLETCRSVGSYDLDKLGKDIYFRVGNEGEVYQGISDRKLNLENLPILADESGPFGSPTADSKRAIINEETTNVMMVIISFDGEKGLEGQLVRLANLLEEFASAQNVHVNIIGENCKFLIEKEDLDSVGSKIATTDGTATHIVNKKFEGLMFSKPQAKDVISKGTKQKLKNLEEVLISSVYEDYIKCISHFTISVEDNTTCINIHYAANDKLAIGGIGCQNMLASIKVIIELLKYQGIIENTPKAASIGESSLFFEDIKLNYEFEFCEKKSNFTDARSKIIKVNVLPGYVEIFFDSVNQETLISQVDHLFTDQLKLTHESKTLDHFSHSKRCNSCLRPL